MEKSMQIDKIDKESKEQNSSKQEKNILFDYQKYIVQDGDRVEINISNAYQYFSKVHIICPIIPSDQFYLDEIVSSESNDSIKNNMIVHTLNCLSILVNKFFINNIKILTKDQISKFRNTGQPFEKNNLVVCILSITYFNLRSFLDMFEKNRTIEDLYKIVLISNFFKLDKKHFKITSEISDILLNLDGSKFWKNPFNTNFNYDYLIKHRVIDKFNKVNTNVNSYENIIIPVNKKFTVGNLERNGKKLLRLTPKVNFTVENANQLYESFKFDGQISKLNKDMIENLLINPKLCHLILNNIDIMRSVSKLITEDTRFKEKFKYGLSYAWITLYNDEMVKDVRVNNSDRFIFDINTASLLPQWEVNSYDLKYNPYISLLVSDKVINSRRNILGLQATSKMKIANFDEFIRQMNIFITGKPYINIFDNIDLVSRNVAICGSIIPACSILNHPNLEKFNNEVLPHNPDEERIDALLRRFYAEYYSKADIDMMISNCDHFEFCRRSNDIFNELLLNFCRFFRDAEPELFKMNRIKQIGLFLTEDFLIEKGFDQEKLDLFKSFINSNDNDNIFNMIKDHISEEYDRIIQEEYSALSEEDKKYCDNFMTSFKTPFNELKEKDISIVFNTKIVKTIFSNSDEKLKIYVNTKLSVSSPFLNHDIEIFRNKNEEPFSLISKFHLNCVRGYFDGVSVKLLPSCITSLKTFINMDFKYFAGKRSPFDIINKYRMRGFGTILNSKEIKEFNEFVKKSKWVKLYHSCGNKKCNGCNNTLGFIIPDFKLFNPRKMIPDDFVHDKTVIFNEDIKYKILRVSIKDNRYTKSKFIISQEGNVSKIK